MTLPVMDILHYDKNPRKAINDQYDVIKESIRSTKQLTSPLVVTRRPGQDKFMVGKGGNTRLTALQELFSETGDAAFQYVVVTYTPWLSESSTLSAHLVENELRGEMIFWDKAKAYADLKQMIESETGNPLSARAFEQTLKERGLLDQSGPKINWADGPRAIGLRQIPLLSLPSGVRNRHRSREAVLRAHAVFTSSWAGCAAGEGVSSSSEKPPA